MHFYFYSRVFGYTAIYSLSHCLKCFAEIFLDMIHLVGWSDVEREVNSIQVH